MPRLNPLRRQGQMPLRQIRSAIRAAPSQPNRPPTNPILPLFSEVAVPRAPNESEGHLFENPDYHPIVQTSCHPIAILPRGPPLWRCLPIGRIGNETFYTSAFRLAHTSKVVV